MEGALLDDWLSHYSYWELDFVWDLGGIALRRVALIQLVFR